MPFGFKYPVHRFGGDVSFLASFDTIHFGWCSLPPPPLGGAAVSFLEMKFITTLKLNYFNFIVVWYRKVKQNKVKYVVLFPQSILGVVLLPPLGKCCLLFSFWVVLLLVLICWGLPRLFRVMQLSPPPFCWCPSSSFFGCCRSPVSLGGAAVHPFFWM